MKRLSWSLLIFALIGEYYNNNKEETLTMNTVFDLTVNLKELDKIGLLNGQAQLREIALKLNFAENPILQTGEAKKYIIFYNDKKDIHTTKEGKVHHDSTGVCVL